MWMAGQVRHLEKGDRRGRQKVLILIIAVLINVDGVCRSCGQVRHLEKGDRRGGQKVLIRTMAVSRNVGGEDGSCWMAGQVRR